jgi:phosphatidylglycerol:prolipoprotein diacylglycerol transferase
VETFPFTILFALSLLIGFLLTERRSSDPGLARMAYLMGIWSGFVGARLLYAAQYGGLSFLGGISAWGFIIGGGVGTVTYLLWRTRTRESLFEFGDAVSPAVALGGALTRVGCFLRGCNFGKVCELPWAVRYPPGSPAFDKHVMDGLIDPSAEWSRTIHPTQLYETVALLAAFFVILRAPRFSGPKLLQGEPYLGLTIYYGVVRFLNEFLRDDSGGLHFGPLTFAQATSLIMLVSAAYIVVIRRLHHRRNPRPYLAG